MSFPRRMRRLSSLRRAAAIIAQLLDTTLSSDELTAPTECSKLTSTAPPGPEQAPQDFDLQDQASRDEAFEEMVGNSAPLQELLDR